MNNVDLNTDASRIYDHIYGHIASKENYKITNATKSSRIEKILTTMDFDEKTILRACCKYFNYDETFEMAAKVSKIDKKRLAKYYKLAKRHMYSPNNIRLAVPGFYNITKLNQKSLTKEDFYGQQYIVTALNKSGIDTREKLLKHLSLGWYYLWSIPGCGDNARQYILMAIDKWNEDDNNERN